MKPNVDAPWAACLPSGSLSALDHIRLEAGLEVLCDEGDAWVRSRSTPLPTDIPWREVFAWRSDEQLIPPGHRLPTRDLPSGAWLPIHELRPVERLAGMLPAREMRRTVLTMAPFSGFREPVLIQTSIEEWIKWASMAPSVRLSRLKFAIESEGKVFVTGNPLPPLSGRRFAGADRIFTPAGMAFSLSLSASTIHKAIGLGHDESAVFLSGGTWIRIPADAWQPATRPLIRNASENRR